MSDVNGTPDIHALYNSRLPYYSGVHQAMDELLMVRDGEVPARYSDMFHEDIPVYLLNMMRLAHDDLTAMAGKVFPIYVPPKNNSAKAATKAEKVEKIAYGWNDAARRAGGPTFDSIMDKLAWWLVLCADAVAMVLPDYKNKTPYFTFRDPRTHYPPEGWSPWSQAPLDNTLFSYEVPLEELIMRYPEKAMVLRNQYTRMVGGWGIFRRSSRTNPNPLVRIGEYYSRDTWMVGTIDDNETTLVESHKGDKGHPGVCPVVPFTLYSATQAKGRPMFADQVPLQMAMARMFSQQIDFYDKTLYPTTFGTKLRGDTVKYGPGAYNEFDQTLGDKPAFFQQAPANPIHADQMLSFTLGLARVLNRNPESMQGGGDAVSAKAINELKGSVNMIVEDGIWPAFIDGLPRLYKAAAEMDINLWGRDAKKSSGVKRNNYFVESYTPGLDLSGYESDITVEPGLGLGGFQGKLEIMQMLGAGMISMDTALEMLPEYRNPQEEKRRIQGDKLDEVTWQTFAARAAELQPGALAEVKRLMAEEDMDLSEAIAKVDAAGALFVPPPDPMAAMGGAPGGNPLAALMGGMPPPDAGGGEAPPPLSMLRGQV